MGAVAGNGNRSDEASRREALLARLRDRQLALAMSGRVVESARYARRAHWVKLHQELAGDGASMLACCEM